MWMRDVGEVSHSAQVSHSFLQFGPKEFIIKRKNCAPSACRVWYLGMFHQTPTSHLFPLFVPALCFALISFRVKQPHPHPSTTITTTKQSLLNTCADQGMKWPVVQNRPRHASSLSQTHTHTHTRTLLRSFTLKTQQVFYSSVEGVLVTHEFIPVFLCRSTLMRPRWQYVKNMLSALMRKQRVR